MLTYARTLARIVVLAAVYILAAKLGLGLAVVNPSATAIWAPTGIAIAAMLIFGYGVWPAVLFGAFIANVTTTGSIETSVAIAAGNTLESLVGAGLVNRFAGGRAAFHTPAGVFKFALYAAALAPLAPLVSATIGVTSLSLAGSADWADYPRVWGTWWLGDATGAIIVTPFMVAWSDRGSVRSPPPRWWELATFWVALIGTAAIVFRGTAATAYPLGFLLVPLLAWSAFRFGQLVTSTAIMLLATLTAWGTWRSDGPLVGAVDLNAWRLVLEAFMAAQSMTFLSVAAAVRQRDELLLGERQARELAESAVKARDEFLSIASHELRTPMAALSASVQLIALRRDRGDLDWNRFDSMVTISNDAADHLTRLINDLLDVSRVQSGNLKLASGGVDVGTLVEGIVERTRHQLGELHTITVDLESSPLMVWGDAERLDQVLTNLLENAVKYSPAGGDIAVSLASDSAPNEEGEADLVIAVRDAGIGLPQGAVATIFEPFGRAPNAMAGQLPGMGLGLYISRRIVEAHGGRIWAESPGENQGTAVFVALPRYGPA